jgi:hypothetical protein
VNPVRRAIFLFTTIILLSTALCAPATAASGGRGPIFEFTIKTDATSYEAVVSDPTKPSVSVVATITNTGTSLESVRVSASVNLGGSVQLSTTDTGLLLPNGEATVIATVTLPEDTAAPLSATLRIDGVCDQNPSITDFKQLVITIRQWHLLRLDNLTVSSKNPVVNELITINAKLRNNGNGPSNFAASAYLEGKPVRLRADGSILDPNSTISLEKGKFALLSIEWKAIYGHYNFLIHASDLGSNESANASAFANDSRVIHVFVNVNVKDWVPFIIIGLGIAMALGVVAYKKRIPIRAFLNKYRKKRRGDGSNRPQGHRATGPQGRKATRPQGHGATGVQGQREGPSSGPPHERGVVNLGPPKRPSMSERFKAGMKSAQARARQPKGTPPPGEQEEPASSTGEEE